MVDVVRAQKSRVKRIERTLNRWRRKSERLRALGRRTRAVKRSDARKARVAAGLMLARQTLALLERT